MNIPAPDQLSHETALEKSVLVSLYTLKIYFIAFKQGARMKYAPNF